MQVSHRCTTDESRTRRTTNAQIVSADHIDDFTGSIEAIKLPIGEQSGRQATVVELVLVVGRDFGSSTNIVPDSHVVKGSAKYLIAVKATSKAILLLSENQFAGTWRAIERSALGKPGAIVGQLSINVDSPITVCAVPCQ